jgi:hypothetical protein
MAVGSLAAENLMGVTGRVMAGREAAIAGQAADTAASSLRQASDSMARSPELTSALLNRSAEVQQQIADLTARTDVLANKLGAVKKILESSKSDNTWYVNTWNSETRYSNHDDQISFLRRRWENDRGHFEDMRGALHAETPVHASVPALPVLTEEDVVLSDRAIGSLRRNLQGAQQTLAELTTKHDLLAAKVESAKGILKQQEGSHEWFTNDWNNVTRHQGNGNKVSRLREMWDTSDGYRNSLSAIL